jgi:hypothetical protein
MAHANCLQCGAPTHAEDGGLCHSCTAEVHGPEPEPTHCECGLALLHIAGDGVQAQLCGRCDAERVDELVQEARQHADELAERAGRRCGDDPRFTMGLLLEVKTLLKKHGYQEHPRKRGDTMLALFGLVEAFEGKAP